MSWEPCRSVVRVLTPDGATAGTAFFVTGGEGALLATCAHVIHDVAGLRPGDVVALVVGRAAAPSAGCALTATVLPEFWRSPDREDVAVLRLEGDLPPGCTALPLTMPLGPGRSLKSWGYPLAKASEGLGADVSHLAPGSEGGVTAVQARSEEVSHGFSGAPVWDDEADAAIGMVMSIVGRTADPGGRQQTTFFVRPTEVLREVCPALATIPENPYRGLDVFEERHADIFFGRTTAITTLLSRLERLDLVAVVGPSGSGKSSLVRAGLEKGLRSTPVLGLVDRLRVVMRPGRAPALDLTRAMDEVAPREGGGAAATDTLAPADLAATVRRRLAPGAILILDQFERLFTECDQETRQSFVDALLRIAGDSVKVLVTLRADFYGRVLEHRAFGAAVERGQVTMLPMTHDELREAVVEPARARLRALEAGLAEQLVRDVEGRPGDLPLLQLALTELWERDAAGGVLRQATYRALGSHTADGEPLRLRGVIAQVAERRWAALDDDERSAAQKVLISLVAPAALSELPAAPEAGRRAWQLEWDDAMRAVARQLVDARLLTTGMDTATGEATVEVAHEALIWAWPRLRRLASQHGDLVRWYGTDLAPFLRRWTRDRSPDLLLRGEALTAAERWLATAPELFSGAATQFIARSVEHRRHEQDRARREAEHERERLRAQALSESLRLASEAREAAAAEPEVALLVAWEALLRDRNELSEAVFREVLEHLPARVRMLRSGGARVLDAGFLADGTTYAADVHEGTVDLWGAGGASSRFAAAGDGAMAIAAFRSAPGFLTCRDGVLRRHSGFGEEIAAVELPDAPPVGSLRRLDIAISGDDATCVVHADERMWIVSCDRGLAPSRAFVLVADAEQFIRLAQTAEVGGARAEPIGEPALHGPLSVVWRIAIGSDGRTILSEASDGVRLWNRDGTFRCALPDTQGPASACMLAKGVVLVGTMSGAGTTWTDAGVLAGTFRDGDGMDLYLKATHPTGEYVAGTVRRSGAVEVRDAAGAALVSLPGHDGDVWSVAFSPDGRLLATGCDDGSIRIWDWGASDEPAILRGHDDTVHQVAFSPVDASQLLSADHSGQVRRWHLDDAAVPPLTGHDMPVRQLVPLGDALLSSDEERTLLWDRDGTPASLDGRLIAWRESRSGAPLVLTAGTSGATLWRVDRGRAVRVCDMPDTAREAAISPTGQHVLLVAGASAVLRSVDGRRTDLVGTPALMVESAHSDVAGAGFRPDGSAVAVASKEGTVWLWTVDGSPSGQFLADHASPDRVFDMACDPRGELLATGVRNEVGLWDWAGQRVGRLDVGGYKVKRVAFSPDGGRILTIADAPSSGRRAIAELWNRAGERVAAVSWLETDLYAEPRFDAQGRYVCMPHGRGVAVIDADGGRLATLAGPPGTHLVATAVSADCARVAAAFSDGRTRLWNHGTRRHEASLTTRDAHAIAFAPDGGELLVGSSAGPIFRHPLDVEELFPAAAARIGRPLRVDELERFDIANPMVDLAAIATRRP